MVRGLCVRSYITKALRDLRENLNRTEPAFTVEEYRKLQRESCTKDFRALLERALVCLLGQPWLQTLEWPISQIELCGTSCASRKPLLQVCSGKVFHWELWFMFQLQRGFGNSWDMLWRRSGLQHCQSASLPREHVLCSFNSLLIIFSRFPRFCHAV